MAQIAEQSQSPSRRSSDRGRATREPGRGAYAPRIACAVLWALSLAACTAGSGDTGEGSESGASGGDTSSTGDVLPPPPMAEESCALAPTVDPGRISGSLRDIEVGVGVCGVAGPTTYLQVAPGLDADVIVSANAAGFSPRLGIAPDGCVAGREFACGGDDTLELRDVAAGTVLTVAIGAAATDPGLAAPPPMDGSADPLDFTVDIGLRRILDLGERCLPESRGRCPGGSLCAVPVGGDPGDLSAWVCEPLAGDTCASAELLRIDAPDGEFSVDPALPQTDAHAHACTGEGLLERVLRLQLDTPLPPGARLEVSTKVAVGLAARGPGCTEAAEIACAEAESGLTLMIEDLEGFVAAQADPYLFVEWPASEDGEGGEPILLSWTVLGE